MKSLANDIRIIEGKSEESIQDHKNALVQGQKKLQQIIDANIEHQTNIKLLEKEVQALEAGNKELDDKLELKIAQLQKVKDQLEEQEEKDENQGQQEMQAWITQVQNYSGVPDNVIDQLICLAYEGSASDNEICLSCYQPMQQGVECKYLPCSHLFHSQCISKHLKVNKLCPACGEPVCQ